MNSDNISFISESLRKLDELSPETYLSAADQRYNQAERLEMMADAATNQADKAALLAAARGLYGKMDKLQARADTKDHQWRDPAPSQLDELNAATYKSAADKREKQAIELGYMATSKHPSTIDADRAAFSNAADAAYNKRNDLRRGQGQAEYRVKTQKDKERQTDQLLGAGINPSGSLLRKAGLSSAQPPAGRPPVPPPPAGRPSLPPVPPPPAGRPPVPPRRQDESKVFRIYRNSDQSATVVMESGVAVWLAPKSVNKVLSESGNINRTKLHRLLESRIWK